MKRRMIDGGIWANEKFAELSCTARLLQIGLVTLADDQGRVKAHPSYLRSQLFPYDEDVSVADIRKWLAAIVSNGTAIVYEAGGKEYIQLLNWWDYQSLQYAAPSDMPRPDGWQDRIRYNGKGNIMLTCNWITVNGEQLDDLCDEDGKPLPVVATLPPKNQGGRPPKNPGGNPPGNPPTFPPENVNKDKYKININEEAATRAPARMTEPPEAAAATDPNVSRLWQKWDANMPGTRTPVIVDAVNSLLGDYSAAEIEEAITIACERNNRSMSYVKGILAKGAFSAAPPGKPTNNGLAAIMDYTASKGMFNERNR